MELTYKILGILSVLVVASWVFKAVIKSNGLYLALGYIVGATLLITGGIGLGLGIGSVCGEKTSSSIVDFALSTPIASAIIGGSGAIVLMSFIVFSRTMCLDEPAKKDA